MKNLAIVPGSKLLKAMGNARRLEILYYLMQNEMNVTELEKAQGRLAQAVGLSQSALSQHLAILRAENVVKTRREAQTIYYSIKSEKALKILQLLDSLYNQPYK